MAERHEVVEIDPEDGNIQADDRDVELGAGDVTGLPCKLCFDDITAGNKFTMETCGCFFCMSCMKTYLEVLIKDGVVLSITCPDAECVIQGQLQIHEITSLVQRDTFEKYLKLKFEQEIAIDPGRAFCPNVHCATVCQVFVEEEQKRKGKKKTKDTVQQPVEVSCPSCYLNFCNICKAKWSENHKCAELGHSVGSELMKLRAKAGFSTAASADAVIKRCPVCNVLIEKDRGCAQMICKNCSHVFCWYCLKLLDNDFMLRHYDKGPCKNFLGHSRAQVFRHRMGVIGLFTAFSLLLLVASPIILLAAPVFLCCKWKECCERALRRAQQENNNALYTQTENNTRMRRSNLDIVSEVVGREQRNSSEPVFPPVASVHPAGSSEEATEQTNL